MRFTFTNGGKSGCTTPEALADYMEGFVQHKPPLPGAFQPRRIEIFDSGDMLVDFSGTNSASGEIFREAKHLRVQIIKAIANGGDERQELRTLALNYWAEAESLHFSRTVEPSDDVRVALRGGISPWVAGREELDRTMVHLMRVVQDTECSCVVGDLENWDLHAYDEENKARGPLVLTSAELQKLIHNYQRTPTQRAALVNEILARAEAALIATPQLKRKDGHSHRL